MFTFGVYFKCLLQVCIADVYAVAFFCCLLQVLTAGIYSTFSVITEGVHCRCILQVFTLCVNYKCYKVGY